MALDIVIPTCGRIKKLLNCLRSIEKSKQNYNVKVYVYFSLLGELDEVKKLINVSSKDWLELRIVHNYIASRFWNDYLKEMTSDAMLYCNDDVEFLEDTIEKIYLNYQFYFPDNDGVLGLNQSNITENQAIKSAFGVIGANFADKFPDRQVMCPQYFYFYLDAELGLFANSINKFKYAEDCKIIHYHPSFGGKRDSTHSKIRKFLKYDRRVFEIRRYRNLLWGETFKKVSV